MKHTENATSVVPSAFMNHLRCATSTTGEKSTVAENFVVFYYFSPLDQNLFREWNGREIRFVPNDIQAYFLYFRRADWICHIPDFEPQYAPLVSKMFDKVTVSVKAIFDKFPLDETSFNHVYRIIKRRDGTPALVNEIIGIMSKGRYLELKPHLDELMETHTYGTLNKFYS